MFMDIRLLLNSYPNQDVPIEWLWLKADAFVLHMPWILHLCRNSPVPRFNQTSAESTIHALSLSRFGPENHVRCLSDVRILFVFLKKLSVIRPYKDEKELSVLSVSLSADAWVRLQIVKFWEYDQIQKGSWFNDQAKQTELLLLSKSQSQNYCENIIGNTTLPYELWHLDDLKYESSLDSGQGWMKTNMYRANIGVC